MIPASPETICIIKCTSLIQPPCLHVWIIIMNVHSCRIWNMECTCTDSGCGNYIIHGVDRQRSRWHLHCLQSNSGNVLVKNQKQASVAHHTSYVAFTHGNLQASLFRTGGGCHQTCLWPLIWFCRQVWVENVTRSFWLGSLQLSELLGEWRKWHCPTHEHLSVQYIYFNWLTFSKCSFSC